MFPAAESQDKISRVCDTMGLDYDSIELTETSIRITRLDGASKTTVEIANIGRSRPNWHYSTTDLIAIERAALKKLRDNDDIYVIRFC